MATTENPEVLLDAFRAAALSVTKLYKTSAAAQSKARADGYQDCLEDLLAYLDKERLGLMNLTEARKIRSWVTERIEGRDTSTTTAESEDEVDKAETASSPELHRAGSVGIGQPPISLEDTPMRTDSAPPSIQPVVEEQEQHREDPKPTKQEQQMTEIPVPTLDNFNFTSQMQYPADSYLSIENLDLSDKQSRHSPSHVRNTTSSTISRTSRRHGGSGPRSGNRSTTNILGQKRKLDLGEFFEVKDVFGNRHGKRNRHN